ncbi:serine-rich adhesin for platelets-like isoform X2 [Brienomyrus brachyistius]|uniref:serine-rich adhesin for platelets-like isoform X2 n=1 Tax=Brienomyrus brachyistius TaxID=42636 RepID=UPI0020B39190|nr:serine-rich adhesin for platelets-like isoform X2 [Brienomyrus brachyistius]
MDVTVVLLLLLHSVRGTELLEPSAQPTNFSLPEDSDAWAYASMLFGNETEDSPSFQENVTNATMNNTETDLYITGSNETWTSKEDVDNYDRTFDNASTNDTNLNITDTNDTNNTNTSKDEMGSGFSDAESGETTPSPDYNITKSNNPEDITTITTIAATTSGINSTTTSTTTTTASTSTTSTNSSLDDRRDIVYTENNRAVAGSNTRNNNATAWAIVIGTAMAVGVVSLIVYILKKRRDHRDFNHRKLVEDLPAGPVLRLDSYENLGMGTLAFNNPVLQGDDIHMDHMGGSQNKH